MSEETFKCTECGQLHSLSTQELVFYRPDDITELLNQDEKVELFESNDLCRIESKRFFVRGVLPLPVIDRERRFRIGAWVELDKEGYTRVIDLWDDENQACEPGLPGCLANSLPNHKETVGIRVELRLTGPTSRPDIIVTEKRHQLFKEQKDGISLHRVAEYNDLPNS